MKIRRSRLTSDFVQLPNSTVRDVKLSYMARGILAELLSRPDGWESTADELWRQAAEARGPAGEGRRAFRAAFAELKTHNYIVAARERLPGGRHGTVLTVYDVPKTDVPAGGTSVRPVETEVSAGQTDVPPAGTSVTDSEVPPVGTSVRPAESGVLAGRTDVPPTDVPHGGTSSRKRSTKTEKTGVAVVPQLQDARARGVDPLRPHPWENDGDGSCKHCNLPRNNTRRHPRGAA